MITKPMLTSLLLLLHVALFAQTDTIRISEGLHFPGDAATKATFLFALNGFWQGKDGADSANPFIDKTQFAETSALLDEMREIESNEELKDAHFYAPYLTNVVALPCGRYKVQLAVAGISHNQPVNRAAFTFDARRDSGGYVFHSPLRTNTAGWKETRKGSFVFHYPVSISTSDISAYMKTASSYDKKLGATGEQTDIYMAADFPQVLSLTGIDYKADYNGDAFNTLSAREKGRLLLITGVDTFGHFDPHDLWHDRLRNVYSPAIINRPVDEGCAYLYGGSWGTPWADVLALFKQKVVKPGADYLSLYEPAYNFSDNRQKPFIAGYVMNALIVQKLEREHRFDNVIELLTCGKYEKGNANYFAALEKATGMNRGNFNQKMEELIESR